MPLVGSFKLAVTNLTASPIVFEDITNTVWLPSSGTTEGYPTVPASGTLELIVTREALVSWERGRLREEIDGTNITVAGSGGGDQHYSVAAKTTVINPDGVVVVGQIAFDGSRVQSPTIYFDAVASVTAAVTGTIQLYNLTDGESVSTHSVSALSATRYRNALTLGNGVGQVKLSNKIYEIRASVTGSTAADILYLGQAYLRIEV